MELCSCGVVIILPCFRYVIPLLINLAWVFEGAMSSVASLAFCAHLHISTLLALCISWPFCCSSRLTGRLYFTLFAFLCIKNDGSKNGQVKPTESNRSVTAASEMVPGAAALAESQDLNGI